MSESNTAHSIAPANGHRIQPNDTEITTSMNARTPFSRLWALVLIDDTAHCSNLPAVRALEVPAKHVLPLLPLLS